MLTNEGMEFEDTVGVSPDSLILQPYPLYIVFSPSCNHQSREVAATIPIDTVVVSHDADYRILT